MGVDFGRSGGLGAASDRTRRRKLKTVPAQAGRVLGELGICKPNCFNIVQNVVQFVQYCNSVPIRTTCTTCTTAFTNIVQKV